MAFGGLFLSIRSVDATSPNMQVIFLGDNNDTPSGYSHNVTLNPGQFLAMRVEIHNTIVGTTAQNVVVKTALPSGAISGGQVVTTVSASNANTTSDTVNVTVNGGGSLSYVPNTTRITWDQNGDGIREFDNTLIADGITQSGIALGNQQGCNEFIIFIFFLVKVNPLASPTPTPVVTPTPTPSPSATPTPTPTPVMSPPPTPTPTPTPVVTPTPTPTPEVTPVPTPTPTPMGGGINISNNNTNTNTNTNENNIDISNTQNQTQNVTVSAPAGGGQVLSANVPVKQPETGVGVLGMVSMFSAAPVGFVLSRFGRGRMSSKREDEDLSYFGRRLVRSKKV